MNANSIKGAAVVNELPKEYFGDAQDYYKDLEFGDPSKVAVVSEALANELDDLLHTYLLPATNEAIVEAYNKYDVVKDIANDKISLSTTLLVKGTRNSAMNLLDGNEIAKNFISAIQPTIDPTKMLAEMPDSAKEGTRVVLKVLDSVIEKMYVGMPVMDFCKLLYNEISMLTAQDFVGVIQDKLEEEINRLWSGLVRKYEVNLISKSKLLDTGRRAMRNGARETKANVESKLKGSSIIENLEGIPMLVTEDGELNVTPFIKKTVNAFVEMMFC